MQYLQWMRATEEGRAWLDSLPALVDDCANAWRLTLGDPFPYVYRSLVLPVKREDGTDAVLKFFFPDRESLLEGMALEKWNGDGAVRLLSQDPPRDALLLERCIPGTPLSEVDPEISIEVLIRLLPRLWKATDASPFRSLAEEAAWWASYLRPNWEGAGRPFEERLIDAALDALAVLPQTQGEQVLLHMDLHGLNVLRAEREPWLVIDPKPLVGEREFGLAPIIRSVELGEGKDMVRRRLDRLSGELGMDRERARLWCLAQTVAWSIGTELVPRHVETARWLLEM
jgi:streptomycin 6-kinase